MTTISKTEFAAAVAAFVQVLNNDVALQIAKGNRPQYRQFGYTMGSKHARIFSMCEHNDSRSSRMFMSIDGLVRRADSWKQVGRVLGSWADVAPRGYALGPILSGPKVARTSANDATPAAESAQESFLAAMGAL